MQQIAREILERTGVPHVVRLLGVAGQAAKLDPRAPLRLVVRHAPPLQLGDAALEVEGELVAGVRIDAAPSQRVDDRARDREQTAHVRLLTILGEMVRRCRERVKGPHRWRRSLDSEGSTDPP